MPEKNQRVCPVCGSEPVNEITVPFPLFRHLDFGIFNHQGGQLGDCRKCGAVFRIVTPKQITEIESIYQSLEYAQHKENHGVRSGGNNVSTLASMQAEILSDYLPEGKINILDIGCFDGSLLSELGKKCDPGDLCGCDVAASPDFPNGKPFRFAGGDLNKVEGEFDLVIFSQSLQYMKNPVKTLKKLKSVLKPDGIIFVHAPNYYFKPCSLLLGDQFFYFNENSLSNILAAAGYEFEAIENNQFPRDLLAIGRRGINMHISSPQEQNSPEHVIGQLSSLIDKAKSISTEKRLGILGTTIEAAFVKTLLGERISFFVDENPARVGTDFYENHVLNPKQLSENDCVFIPISDGADNIKKRLTAIYPAEFINLQ